MAGVKNKESKSINNIAIFCRTLEIGGAEKQAVLLADALHKRYKVYFVIFYGDKINSILYKKLAKNNIQLQLLKGSFIQKITHIVRFLYRNRIDLIFNYLLLPNFVGGLISKITPVKYSIGGIRSSYLVPKKVLINKILHNYINDKTIFNNLSGLKRYIKQGFKKENAVVIPNGIILRGLSNTVSKKNNLPIILSVGRFDISKDYNTALLAVRKLVDKNLHFKYIIIGWGDLEGSLRKKIISLKLQKHVELYVNPPDIENFFKEADIFLQTSIFEGLSNSIMEALNFCLPVVATDVGDNKYLIKDGKTGFLSHSGNADEISNYLYTLLENVDKRRQMGIAGRNLLEKEFSYSKFQAKYENFIESLTEGK